MIAYDIFNSLEHLNKEFTKNKVNEIINKINRLLADENINLYILNMTDEYKKNEMKKFLLYEKYKNDYKDFQSNHYHIQLPKKSITIDFLSHKQGPVTDFEIETYDVRLDTIAFYHHMLGHAILDEESKQFIFKLEEKRR